MSDHAPSNEGPRARSLGEVFAAWGLSYLLMFALLGTLVYLAGIWNVLANTRLLDLFIEGGIIRYHDLHQGIVDGVGDHESYLLSQDPIDWRLVLIAALIYFAYWAFKGIKYHGVARFVGMKGTPGQHARAWLYGDGLARFFPMRFGEQGTTSALVAQGEDPVKIRQTYGIVEFLTVFFQIGLFWFFGLWVTDYSIWFAQSLWALVICAVTYLIARRTGLISWEPASLGRQIRRTYRVLADRPATFAKLAFLAVVLMLLDDITPFVIAMAFTGDNVILNVPFFVIQSGVVAGYIARRFPITPLGIGQWEWGFALALYASGVGLPEAATIALLDSFVRHTTGFIVWLVIRLGPGIKTNYQAVMRRYRGLPPLGATETPSPSVTAGAGMVAPDPAAP